MAEIQRKRKIDDDKLKFIVRCAKSGKFSIREIANELGIGERTVQYWLGLEGVKMVRKKKPKVVYKKISKKPTGKGYYHFVNEASKRGSMSRSERNRALNLYYRNRRKMFIEESPIEEL